MNDCGDDAMPALVPHSTLDDIAVSPNNAATTTTTSPDVATAESAAPPLDGVTEMVIDVRERDLIDAMRDRNGVRVATLELGDIVLRWRGTTVLTIERKTLADLAASIGDGRYHEQKLRLMRAADVDPTRTLYLLEGAGGAGVIARQTLLGVVVNTMLRDNMKVYRTSTLAESVELLERMRVRLIDRTADASAYFASGASASTSAATLDVAYASTLKRVKKENLDARTCIVSQLAQVPGVSAWMAGAIVGRYGASMARLCDELRASPSGERQLADLVWSTPSGRQRRIGPSVARRLRAYLIDGVSPPMPATASYPRSAGNDDDDDNSACDATKGVATGRRKRKSDDGASTRNNNNNNAAKPTKSATRAKRSKTRTETPPPSNCDATTGGKCSSNEQVACAL